MGWTEESWDGPPLEVAHGVGVVPARAGLALEVVGGFAAVAGRARLVFRARWLAF